MTALCEVVDYLDTLLDVRNTPDAPSAHNGLQIANSGQVTRVAAAVDASERTIHGALDAGASLLLVHHGLFWGWGAGAGGMPHIVGRRYAQLKTLLTRDLAVYSAHIPLDRHPTLGNNVLLARALDLEPTGEFGRFYSISIGVRGTSDIPTEDILKRAASFARGQGGDARASAFATGRRTRSWAICTGAGANAETLDEASELGIDTLIVGEGPHWTAVDAPQRGLVIVYAGHYATETPGVQALAQNLEAHFGLPWTFVAAPTGL
jgi:dinuclear metal center YbgI/SA1388 family protein